MKPAFRTRNWQPPIDNQPVAWIDTAIRNYFRPYKLEGNIPAQAKVLAKRGRDAAALLVPYGKGEVLCFVGVIDWMASPGLPLRIANWASNRPLDAKPSKMPELLTSPMERGDTLFVLGRRYVSHELISKLKQGKKPEEVITPVSLSVKFPQAKAGKYHVVDLLYGTDFGVLTADDLKTKGVTLSLQRGQAFLLEANPAK